MRYAYRNSTLECSDPSCPCEANGGFARHLDHSRRERVALVDVDELDETCAAGGCKPRNELPARHGTVTLVRELEYVNRGGETVPGVELRCDCGKTWQRERTAWSVERARPARCRRCSFLRGYEPTEAALGPNGWELPDRIREPIPARQGAREVRGIYLKPGKGNQKYVHVLLWCHNCRREQIVGAYSYVGTKGCLRCRDMTGDGYERAKVLDFEGYLNRVRTAKKRLKSNDLRPFPEA